MKMLDLCSGFGGASEAMKRNGWDVTRLDLEPRVKPDIVADLLALPFEPFPVDLLWISIPCIEYSRLDMPWLKGRYGPPDLTLYREARSLCDSWPARFFCMENVRGAQKFWGTSTYHVGPYHLWTNLPFGPSVWSKLRPKHNLCSGYGDPLRSAKAGRLPYELSDSIRRIVEWAL